MRNRRNVDSVAKTSRKNVEEAGGRYQTYGGYALQTVETWVQGRRTNWYFWNHVNLLCEEKRTDGDRFMLSMLRTDQLKGLINFEKALDRNIGLVLVSFLNEAVDVAYAFRLVHAMAYMNQKGRRYITLEELQQGKIEAINLPRIEINGERGYDLKGVRDCTYTKAIT